MKKYCTIISFNIICLLLFIPIAKSQATLAVFDADISNTGVTAIRVGEISEGNLQYEHMRMIEAPNGRFAVPFNIQEATVYWLSVNGSRPVAFLMKPGERVSASIAVKKPAGETSSIVVSFKNPSAENALLQQWEKSKADYLFPAQIPQTAAEWEQFVQKLSGKKAAFEQFINKANVAGNADFTAWFKQMARAELIVSPLYTFQKSKALASAGPTAKQKSFLLAQCKQLKQLKQATVLQTWIAPMLNGYYAMGYFMGNNAKPVRISPADTMAIGAIIRGIVNDTLKGHFVAAVLEEQRTNTAINAEAMKPYQQYMLLPYMQKAYLAKFPAATGLPTLAQENSTSASAKSTQFPVALSASVAASDLSSIQLQVSGFKPFGDITLDGVKQGASHTLAISRNAEKAVIQFAVPVTNPGFYYLNCDALSVRIYLKKGENLAIKMSPVPAGEKLVKGKEYQYEIVEGSAENRALQQWFMASRPVTVHGYFNLNYGADTMSAEQYIGNYEKHIAQIKSAAEKTTTGNQEFDRLVKLAASMDMHYAPIKWLACKTSRSTCNIPQSFKGFGSLPSFYKELTAGNDLTTTDILSFKEAIGYLHLYSKMKLDIQREEAGPAFAEKNKIPAMMEAIPNDTLKALVLEPYLNENDIVNLTDFRNKLLPAEPYLFTAAVQKKYAGIHELFISDTMFLGKEAVLPSMPDSNGVTINFELFKGKVIFIDTWATWCGPCKEQIPFLKQLEHHYKERNDIMFVGISVDREKDKEKWKKMIRKESLPGLQVLDVSGNAFRLPMMIESIPRFLLIDKAGKWMEVRCPKPSTGAELKSYIDKALAETL